MALHGFPNKNGDRWAWERAWSRRLAAQYNPSFSRPRLLDNPGVRHLLDTVGLDEQTIFSMLRIRDAVCEVQRDLAGTAVKALAQDDFEKKWTSLSKKAREKLILDGIHHACCASGDMEGRRDWCPDVTVEALEVGRGRGYTKILKLLLPPDAVSRTSPDLLVVPHPAVDALLHITPAEAQKPAYKHQVDSTRVMRMYFISLVTLNVILGFVSGSPAFSVAYILITTSHLPVVRNTREVCAASQVTNFSRCLEETLPSHNCDDGQGYRKTVVRGRQGATVGSK
jgi:hypothetical protein